MSKSVDPIPFRSKHDATRFADPPATGNKGRPRGLPTAPGQPTDTQRAWLSRGLDQAGGKLPLFDADGRRVDARTIRTCVEQGWAEPWFANPLKPDWLVCRLTDAGRILIAHE